MNKQILISSRAKLRDNILLRIFRFSLYKLYENFNWVIAMKTKSNVTLHIKGNIWCKILFFETDNTFMEQVEEDAKQLARKYKKKCHHSKEEGYEN